MKKSFFILSFCLFLVSLQINAQSLNPPFDSISFRLSSHNNIIIKALLNGKDSLNLMFHTGTSSLSLIKSSGPKLNSIKWSSETEVQSWGGSSSARFSENNSLKIGGIIWDSLPIWENENSGPETDGKFGPNFFAGKVLEFDFEKNYIFLHDSLPNTISQFSKLGLTNDEGSLFMEAWTSIDTNRYKNKFLIHSGFGGSVLFDDAFSAKHKLGEQLEIFKESELRDSYGNVLKTKKAILPHFQIAEFILQDLPIGFFEGAIGRQKMSVIGGDILKRFHIILDSKRQFIYLKPNSLMNLAYKA